MLRSFLGASLLAGCVLLASGASAGEAKRPAGEFLMPDTTAGFLAVTNYDQFSAQWDKTQLGHLMADEVMAKFKEDLKEQLQHRWAKTKERLGLTLDDLKGLPNGEVVFAMIRPGPGQSALAPWKSGPVAHFAYLARAKRLSVLFSDDWESTSASFRGNWPSFWRGTRIARLRRG